MVVSSLGIPLWSGPSSAEESREISNFKRGEEVWLHALETIQLSFSARLKRHYPDPMRMTALMSNSSFIHQMDMEHDHVQRNVCRALPLITKSWKNSCSEACHQGGITFLLMSGVMILAYFDVSPRGSESGSDVRLPTVAPWPFGFVIVVVLATSLAACAGFWWPRLDERKLRELFQMEIDFINGYQIAFFDQLIANPTAEELQALAAHFEWIRSRERVAKAVEENFLTQHRAGLRNQ